MTSVLRSCTRFIVHVYVVYASCVLYRVGCATFVYGDIRHPLISTCACTRMHFTFDQTSKTSKVAYKPMRLYARNYGMPSYGMKSVVSVSLSRKGKVSQTLTRV